ncbi:MAG: DUF4382 domain-containing protein [Candidatus Kariarchaeaceae archaeon]|jgi:hypothetical protein
MEVFFVILGLGIAYFIYKRLKNKAKLTLSVGDVQGVQTQAATDGVTGVFINFTGLEIQPSEGERLTFEFESKVINLLDNDGKLLEGQEVPVGSYNWIRLLAVNTDSHVQVGEVRHSLVIPSGDQTGLKLNRGFRVGTNGADFTIDFNLEKSLINPGGKGYKLKPVLGLIDNLQE